MRQAVELPTALGKTKRMYASRFLDGEATGRAAGVLE
jgi:hypothetical protein